MYDFLVVGAGFAGSVLAERLASKAGARVLLIDRREHLGGIACDGYHVSGVLIHRYGPHAFHTNSQTVYSYLSRFTSWRPYEHRAMSLVDGRLVPFPINLDTINALCGTALSESQARAFLDERAVPGCARGTVEDHVVSVIGWDLYRALYENYTRKQWGMDPSRLPASIAARIPVRLNRDGRYFTDAWQGIPVPSYLHLFTCLTDHPNICLRLGTDYREVPRSSYRQLAYTGSVDELYEYRLGRLPYRSLKFEHVVKRGERLQPVAQLNYPQHEPYTRSIEHKHMTGQQVSSTVVTYELPAAEGTPFYPLPCSDPVALYEKYKELAKRDGVLLAGRLGSYRYLNMDEVVAQALSLGHRLRRGRRHLRQSSCGRLAQ